MAAINATKCYPQGYVEAWIGFKLATDAELMYSQIGLYGDYTTWTSDEAQQSMTQDVIGVCQTALKVCVGADWSLQGGFCLFGVDPDPNPPAQLPPHHFDAVLAPVAGTRGTGSSAPQNTAVLVKKTVTTGRTGRMYLPGVFESNINPNGSLDGAEITIWQDALIALQVGILDLTGVVGLGMQTSVVGFSATATKTVNALVVDSVVATQRRRLRR